MGYFVQYECGDESEAVDASAAHAAWHWRRKEEPCGKAKAEKKMYQALIAEGGSKRKWRPARYECGEEADATEAGTGHSAWHKRRKEEPCGKAKAESRLYQRKHYGYEGRVYYDHQCGEMEDAVYASTAHVLWHRKRGEVSCDKGLEEARRSRLKHSNGQMRLPMKVMNWNRRHWVYQITFLNGDRYYGITLKMPKYRWEEHLRDKSILGEMMRSGLPYTAEVICETPNRREARRVERMAIASGNPWGRILNIQHNHHYND